MAIYHLSAKVISRGEGRSCVAAAAYRSGASLTNAQDGRLHDYSRRRFVAHCEILAPDNVPAWMLEREQLWNAVEAAEKRRDAQLAREIEVSLPRELSADEQRDLLRRFVWDQFVAKGMIADIAIHNPKAADGLDQPHAHVMLTMRELTGAGFGKKNRDWNSKDQLGEWREAWADYANRVLEQHGHAARIDHRTLDRQCDDALEQGDEDRASELDREPQPKLGVAAKSIELRGIESDRGVVLRLVLERNCERRNLRERVREVGTQIADVARQLREHSRVATDTIRERLTRAREATANAERARPDVTNAVPDKSNMPAPVSPDVGDRPAGKSDGSSDGGHRPEIGMVSSAETGEQSREWAEAVRRLARDGDRLKRAMDAVRAPDTAVAKRIDQTRVPAVPEAARSALVQPHGELSLAFEADLGEPRGDARWRRRTSGYPQEITARFSITPERDGAVHRVHAGDRDLFRDYGEELHTSQADKSSVRLMLDTAQLRGWEKIRLSGAEEARRDAWLEASLRGMKVRGYEPSEMDRRELAQRQLEQRSRDRTDRADPRETPPAVRPSVEESAERVLQRTLEQVREAQRKMRDRDRER